MEKNTNVTNEEYREDNSNVNECERLILGAIEEIIKKNGGIQPNEEDKNKCALRKISLELLHHSISFFSSTEDFIVSKKEFLEKVKQIGRTGHIKEEAITSVITDNLIGNIRKTLPSFREF